jgi:hypothetical protein
MQAGLEKTQVILKKPARRFHRFFRLNRFFKIGLLLKMSISGVQYQSKYN